MNKGRIRAIVGWVILAVVVLLEIGYGLSAWWISARVSSTTGWPHIKGRVSESRVINTTNPRYGTNYQGYISYTYQVNGTEYSSNRVRFADTLPEVGDVTAYPLGRAVTVYYMPNNPREAVLEPGFTWDHYQKLWQVPVGLLLLTGFVGGGAVFVARRRKARATTG